MDRREAEITFGRHPRLALASHPNQCAEDLHLVRGFELLQALNHLHGPGPLPARLAMVAMYYSHEHRRPRPAQLSAAPEEVRARLSSEFENWTADILRVAGEPISASNIERNCSEEEQADLSRQLFMLAFEMGHYAK